MKSIIMLACWSGTYPWYFSYFVHSCTFNPTIDFVIISDNQQNIENKPDNLKIIFNSLSELEEIASVKLGFPAAIKNGYKMCDFKPAYGYIFSDIVGEYDFWGHMDLDIILGDVRAFLDEQMLETYDLISVRHDYFAGCFGIFKNTPQMNQLFMKSKDYRKVFSDPQHHCFDETNFIFEPLQEGESILDIPTEIESFTEVVKRAELRGEIKVHFDFILLEGIIGNIVFDNGRVIYKNEYEGILYHLVVLKRGYKTFETSKIPPKYWISPTRIYHNLGDYKKEYEHPDKERKEIFVTTDNKLAEKFFMNLCNPLIFNFIVS